MFDGICDVIHLVCITYCTNILMPRYPCPTLWAGGLIPLRDAPPITSLQTADRPFRGRGLPASKQAGYVEVNGKN